MGFLGQLSRIRHIPFDDAPCAIQVIFIRSSIRIHNGINAVIGIAQSGSWLILKSRGIDRSIRAIVFGAVIEVGNDAAIVKIDVSGDVQRVA